MNQMTKSFYEALLELNRIKALQIFKDALKDITALEFIENIMREALDIMGKGWEEGTVALSQVYMSGKICEEIINSELKDFFYEQDEKSEIAIAVLEDYHFLGKRIVYSFLRLNGFSVIDYGGKSVNELVEAVKRDQIKILLVSVLMLSSALRVKELKKALSDVDVKIIVGGAPFRFDQELWKSVGADAMGNSAQDAVEIVQKMTGGDK